MFCSSCCMLWRHPAGCDNSSVSPNILWLLTLNICEKLQCHFFSLIVLLSGEINIFHNRVNVPFRHSSLCWRPGSCPFVGRVRHFRVALLSCSCQTLGFVLTASALYFCHLLPVYLLGLNFESHQRPIKVKEHLCWGNDDVLSWIVACVVIKLIEMVVYLNVLLCYIAGVLNPASGDPPTCKVSSNTALILLSAVF